METLVSKHPAYIVLYMYLAIFYTTYISPFWFIKPFLPKKSLFALPDCVYFVQMSLTHSSFMYDLLPILWIQLPHFIVHSFFKSTVINVHILTTLSFPTSVFGKFITWTIHLMLSCAYTVRFVSIYTTISYLSYINHVKTKEIPFLL